MATMMARFRKQIFVFTPDVQKMYRMMKIQLWGGEFHDEVT